MDIQLLFSGVFRCDSLRNLKRLQICFFHFYVLFGNLSVTFLVWNEFYCFSS